MLRKEAPQGASRKSARSFWWLCLVFTVSQSACNHLFYYPDQRLYVDPSQTELEYREAYLKTDDGESIHYWDFAPRGKASQGKGTVLHFHGNAQNMSSHMLYVIWLVDHGYRVVTFDYRGYGRSSGSPSGAGLLEDSRAMLRWVCRGKPEFMVVVAQSLGGAVAMEALSSLSEHCVDVLVLESTFDSYRDLARDKLDQFFLTYLFQYPLSWLVSDSVAPADSLARFRVPSLVIHGDADPVVPYRFGERIFQQLGSKTKLIWTLEGKGHTAAFVPDSPYRAKLVKQLQQWSSENPPSD